MSARSTHSAAALTPPPPSPPHSQRQLKDVAGKLDALQHGHNTLVERVNKMPASTADIRAEKERLLQLYKDVRVTQLAVTNT